MIVYSELKIINEMGANSRLENTQKYIFLFYSYQEEIELRFESDIFWSIRIAVVIGVDKTSTFSSSFLVCCS